MHSSTKDASPSVSVGKIINFNGAIMPDPLNDSMPLWRLLP
jgi:hypothetical protein